MCSKHSSPKAYCFMARASIAMMLLYVEVFMLLTLDTEKKYMGGERAVCYYC